MEDGGLSITPQIQAILDKPGLISDAAGGGKLRKMFQTQFAEFDPTRLSSFARACTFGDYDAVKQAVESGTSPDLISTQTPFRLGFIPLSVFGAKYIRPCSPGTLPLRHIEVITYLINSGAPVDITDVAGHTALHHACTPPDGHFEIAKLLLEKGANVNAQTRYGEVPICFPFQGGDVKLVDLLMAHGADLDIPDGNGDPPRKIYLMFGAAVTAVVQRWERKRRGEVAPMEEKRCEYCKAKKGGLKQCVKCQVVRYCSTECQRAHWKTHKHDCRPFDAATTVTLKPSYTGPGGSALPFTGTISIADAMREASGLATPSTRAFRPGLTRHAGVEDAWNAAGKSGSGTVGSSSKNKSKSMVIKIQIPVGSPGSMAAMPPNTVLPSALAALFIYNKKRDFVCTVPRTSNPQAYDAVVQVVRSRGVAGAKAYFAAELKGPDELVVKVSEVLAEQPF